VAPTDLVALCVIWLRLGDDVGTLVRDAVPLLLCDAPDVGLFDAVLVLVGVLLSEELELTEREDVIDGVPVCDDVIEPVFDGL
jgi:hypothetical protein